jgi:hypothetical protein
MEVTRERLERAIRYVASVMVRLDLPQLAPILDRLQAELATFEAGEDPIGRARRILAASNDNKPPTRRAA